MVKLPTPRPWGYVLAVAGVVLATEVRLALNPALGPNYPFMTYFLTLLVTVWVGGVGPAVLALVLGALAALCFVIPPLVAFGASEPLYLAGLLAYVVVGTVTVTIFEVERSVRRRLEKEIDDRQRVEDELRKSETRLRLALGAGDLGTWEWDISSGRVSWSENMEAIHGLPAGGFDGTFETYQRLIHPDDREAVLGAIRRSVETLGGYEVQFRIVRAEGSVCWISGRGRALADETGRAVGMIGVASDITERQQAEERLRDADRRKDEFLAMLAHELRNPLAPIRNAVSIMTMDEDDREAQRWSREVIERQVAHLSSLVDDLLDVSRITQGKITLTKAPLGVSSFVSAAVESSRPLIDGRKHTLEVSFPDDPMWVDGDLTRLAQVVLNLLNNAAKYTPEGGNIRLEVGRDGGECYISVRDDGEGISPETLPTVFDLFTQANRSLDRSQGGLGVGLTVVKRLVEMHGGTVEARSEGPGKGSEFVVRLPLRREDSIRPDGTPPKRGPVAKFGLTRRILVVDDSPDARETLKRLLRRLGHEVDVAHDGPSAIEAAVGCTPDLVLLDIGLPGMDGYEVARRLTQEPSLDGISLVALTGYGSESDRRRSTEAGFDHHLVKPVEFDALLQVLESTQVGKA